MGLTLKKKVVIYSKLAASCDKPHASVSGYNSATSQFGSCNYLLYNIYINIYIIYHYIYIYNIQLYLYNIHLYFVQHFEMFIGPLPSPGNN